MPSRGSKRGTPRSAILTSRTGAGGEGGSYGGSVDVSKVGKSGQSERLGLTESELRAWRDDLDSREFAIDQRERAVAARESAASASEDRLSDQRNVLRSHLASIEASLRELARGMKGDRSWIRISIGRGDERSIDEAAKQIRSLRRDLKARHD